MNGHFTCLQVLFNMAPRWYPDLVCTAAVQSGSAIGLRLSLIGLGFTWRLMQPDYWWDTNIQHIDVHPVYVHPVEEAIKIGRLDMMELLLFEFDCPWGSGTCEVLEQATLRGNAPHVRRFALEYISSNEQDWGSRCPCARHGTICDKHSF